jgi:hypothetical protein
MILFTEPVDTAIDDVVNEPVTVGIRYPDKLFIWFIISFTDPVALDTEAVTTEPLGIGIWYSVNELICAIISARVLIVHIQY